MPRHAGIPQGIVGGTIVATESGLVKRGGNAPVRTLRTLVDARAPGSERVKAGIATVGVSSVVIGGGFVGVDALATHAGAIMSTIGTAGDVGLIATGAAGVVGIVVSAGGGRVAERAARSDEGRQRVREQNTSFYRRVGVGTLTVGAVALGAAGAAAGLGDIGLNLPHVIASVGLPVAEAGAGVGLVSLGISRYWAKRSTRLGPNALAE